MKQIAKHGCRILVALLCLAMLISVINVPAFAADTPGIPSSLAGADLSFLMGMLQQYNKVKDDTDAAEQMKEYVEEQYKNDESFKESADDLFGNDTSVEGEENKTLDNMNSVIENVFTEEFTVTWVAGDQTVTETYTYGDTPEYKGETPTKAADDHYTYEFAGWSPVIMKVTGKATYTALFTASAKDNAGAYVVTFVTGSGTFIKTFDSVQDINADGIPTEKAKDSNYEYTFTNTWAKEIDGITGAQTWTAQYERTELSKGWSDILTSGKVVEEYFGSINDVMDAVQNGASVEDLKDSIQHQQKVEQEKAELGEDYVEPEPTFVTWMLDNGVEVVEVAKQQYSYKQLIKQPKIEAMSAGKYISWEMDYVLMPDKSITIYGNTVDIVEEIVKDIDELPMNYDEYGMTYENGVATLYVNVNASNYDDILRDIVGDVREGGVTSAYKSAVMAFLQSSAMHMYNSKTNTIKVNGYEVFGIEGYGASQLVDLLADVQAGNYGEIISIDGIQNVLAEDLITPTDVENMGADGVIGSYEVTLSAEGKQDYKVTLNIALEGDEGDLNAIRKAAKAFNATVDYVISTEGDLDVEIDLPPVFTNMLAKALNHADVSDQTKKTIVEGISQCATVGELLDLFDLLEYDQFVSVVEYTLDHIDASSEKEQALLDKIEDLRPAFDLAKKYGNILIDRVPESYADREASVTFKAIYDLTQTVSFEELAELSQLKDADALVGSARLNDVVARVAGRLNVSTLRATEIVTRMVEVFADYQNRIPDAAKAQSAYDYTFKAIDLIYNKIPEQYRDADLTNAYDGNGEFSFGFSKTYNPTAWLKNLLNKVSITAYGKTLVLGELVPTGNVTSDVSVSVTVPGLYKVTYWVEGVEDPIFEGFLPYKADIAPYGKDAEKVGYTLTWVDEFGDPVKTMPGADTVLTAQYTKNEFTITFVDEDGSFLFSDQFAYGDIPAPDKIPTKDMTNTTVYTFNGWEDEQGNLYQGDLPAVTEDATYTATYAGADRYYTVVLNLISGHSITEEYKYGETIRFEDPYKDTLTHKGWSVDGQLIKVLPVVTGDATYSANYEATIEFYVEGKLYETVYVAYGNTPAPSETPTKLMSLAGYYVFNGWNSKADGTGTSVVSATRHAKYYGDFRLADHFEGMDHVSISGSTISLDHKQSYVNKGNGYNRVTVEMHEIPVRVFELAELYEETTLVYTVKGVTVSGYKMQDVTITLDSKALLSIKKNAADPSDPSKIYFKASYLLGEELGWPSDVVRYGEFDKIFSFEFEGSSFKDGDEGTATIAIPIDEQLLDKVHKYAFSVYYVSETGKVAIRENIKDATTEIVFTTAHFSYYAIDYRQYKFDVTFEGLGNNDAHYTFDIDQGQTLLRDQIPEFEEAKDYDELYHYYHIWSLNTNPGYRVDPYFQFNEPGAPGDYVFVEEELHADHEYDVYEEIDDQYHKGICSCGHEITEPHTMENGVCTKCGYCPEEESSTEEVTTPEEESSTDEVTTPEEESSTDEETTPEEESSTDEETTPEEESSTDEGTTPGGEESSSDEGTTPEEESSTDAGTTPGGEESSSDEEESTPGEEVTTPGEEESTPGEEVTTPGEEESTTGTTEQPESNKNGWWIFLIVLLVIIAILIIAYILYGHNIFPKGPAAEEAPAEQEELTDAQLAAQAQADADAPVEEIHVVDHVAASEVDALMTDAQAVRSVILVASSASGKMGAVNVGTLNDHFEDGDKVDINILKEKKLIDSDCKRVKILADGDLDKTLTVEANSFSLQAIKMITLVGGHAVKLQANAPVAAPAAEIPVAETPAEETSAEETPVEEAPVEETPVEETPVEETPVEETPAEETPAEETAEEAPAEETSEQTDAE